jgi:Na+/melibiose symporter-like transporter
MHERKVVRQMSEAGGPAAAPDPTAGRGAEPRSYSCGTLRYTAAGLATLFFWLLWGDFCWTLFNTAIPGILPLKLNQMGASDTTVSMLVRVLGTGIVLLLAPMVSFKSDRYRSRFGRRIPFLLWSTPLVGLFMILMGCYEEVTQVFMGDAQHVVVFGFTLGRTAVSLGIFAVLLVGFDIVDIYNDTLYYYLFNDVVPPQFLSRFLSLFRMAGLGASVVYNAVFMEHALTRFRIMFVGGGIAYVIGFMLMCLFVKEGQYPPPPENIDRKTGFVSSLKTFARECFSHRFYWYFFLTNALFYTSWCAGTFQVLRNTGSLELSLKQLAWMGVYLSPISMAMMYPAGWLADKYNPIRVYVVVTCVTAFSSFIQAVFAFTAFDPDVNLTIMYGTSILFMPFSALQSAAELPMYMRLLPQDRYGQFCSANGMVRAFAMMIGSAIVGILMQRLASIPATDYRIATHDITMTGTLSGAADWREAAIAPLTVTYGNGRECTGTITAPGASAVRVRISEVRVEHGWDRLTTDADIPDAWSGNFDQVTSGMKTGDTLALRLTSNESVPGRFTVAQVLYLGTMTGTVAWAGELWRDDESGQDGQRGRPVPVTTDMPGEATGAGWVEESVGPWSITYQNNWDRSGSVTVPGATQVRVYFEIIKTEPGIDRLLTDAAGDVVRSGQMDGVFSGAKEGQTITLRLISGIYGTPGSYMTPRRSGNLANDYEVRVTKVTYRGTRTGEVCRAGALWDPGRKETFPLAGCVTDAGGAGVPGVTVRFARAAGNGATPEPTVTDARGNWSRSGFARGSRYTLAASKAEGAETWTFTAPTIGDRRYRFYPFWTIAFQALALTMLFLLYREWKLLGGAQGYTPPLV